MVQAILAGRKTQTRREIKPQPLSDNASISQYNTTTWIDDETEEIWQCPYGQPGDVLWVRETFYAFGHWVRIHNKETNKMKWKFIDETELYEFQYKYADNPPSKFEIKKHPGRLGQYTDRGWYKRPSIFMPRSAIRIFLEITDRRVERLQDISEDDAKAEGIEPTESMYNGQVQLYKQYNGEPMYYSEPCDSFRSLWESINGSESWQQNPFVWVVEFKQISKPI